MDLTYYERYLPHRLPAGYVFFITFRLAGSLPREVIEHLREEKLLLEHEAAVCRAAGHPDAQYTRQKRWFGRFDQCLDEARYGPAFLCQPESAAILQPALKFYHDRSEYDLLAYCLMPNHVHIVVALPESGRPLARILQGLKRYTALEINRQRSETGQVWQRESYDHRVRNDQELRNIIAYTLNNPVKAGLVAEWQHWPYSYWKEV
ncbi:REP-associated tyrosine transposase [Hymenobacter antarcticus]|uniref:Transposase n=1 Tax=Hymenobacter antarcticus TaxID=486270 RepID=A0ABP7QQG7_9BACT